MSKTSGLTGRRKYTTESFVSACRETWGDKYDYSKTVYTASNESLEIVCPRHGSFWKLANMHLNGGQGCPKCSRNSSDSPEINISTGLETFLDIVNKQLPHTLQGKVKVWWFKKPSTGIVCVNISKSKHNSWNLFVDESEINLVVDYLTKGTLDKNKWTSITPTLMHKWSIKAFERFLFYTNRLEGFVKDEG